jgi:LacI family transcriptional regulator
MKELAADLGLSRTTVSLVLGGSAEQYRISSQTRERVRQRARELGFRPNFFARSLNARRTGTVGVLFPNVQEPFMNSVLAGIEDVLYGQDYVMMLSTCRFDDRVEARNIEELIYRGVDGFLFVPTMPFNGSRYSDVHLRRLMKSGIPVVFIDRYPVKMTVDAVLQDDFAAARNATLRLLAHGVSRPRYVGLDLVASTLQDRRAGFRAALTEAGLVQHLSNALELGPGESTEEYLSEALNGDSADGYFVSTSGLARIVQQVLGRRRVPVACFGNETTPRTAERSSRMIVVEQPHREMGARAARLLIERVGAGSKRQKTQQIVIPSMIRETRTKRIARRSTDETQ